MLLPVSVKVPVPLLVKLSAPVLPFCITPPKVVLLLLDPTVKVLAAPELNTVPSPEREPTVIEADKPQLAPLLTTTVHEELKEDVSQVPEAKVMVPRAELVPVVVRVPLPFFVIDAVLPVAPVIVPL